MSERDTDNAPDRSGRDESGPPRRPQPRPADRSAASVQRRQRRIRHLRELVQEADYDVPADEVAARIIRDALFGAPDPDGPS